VPRSGNALALAIAVLIAAALGPVSAIALAAPSSGAAPAGSSPPGGGGGSGGAGLGGGSTVTSSSVSPTGGSSQTRTVITPCSGSLGTKSTTQGPATTTTVPSAVTTYSPNTETVTIPSSSPAIASFTLAFDGQTTAALPVDSDPSSVQQALAVAAPVLSGNITVSGTAGQTYTVQFVGTLADQPQGTIVATGYDSADDQPGTALTVTNTPPSPIGSVPTTTTETTPGPVTVTITPACRPAAPPTSIAVPKFNPFNGRAMWIWELGASNGGNIGSIIAQAKRYGISAVYVKSSDGTGYWGQFSKTLVTDLHEAGLKVCAWQYVYGIQPVVEADLGAKAVRDGADCLVIDAESQYEGKYASAGTYITQLRKLIGKNFPVGLAGFPYVDYHLSFPYSVFLGPGGAQYNLPQMYWADIGTTVPIVYAHTYEYNTIYRRPIFPLGQLWGNLSASSIEQFNVLAKEYGATGVSWWDWQSAPRAYFSDMTRTAPVLVSNVAKTPASLFRGEKGDLVIWAQEHLYAAGYRIPIDGAFGPLTQRAVRAFQGKSRLPRSGVITAATWHVLDSYTPVTVHWRTVRKGGTKAVIARRGAVAGHVARQAAGNGAVLEPVPSWTRHVARRNELHGDPGAGGPPGVGGPPGAGGSPGAGSPRNARL